MREKAGFLPGLDEAEVEWHILSFEAWGKKAEVLVPLLNREQRLAVLQKVKAAGNYIRSLPVSTIIDTIDQVIHRFLDRNNPYRRKAEDLLPIVTGYDPEMIRLGLTSYLKTFRKPQLQRFLVEDLGDSRLLDEFCPRVKGGFAKAYGPELVGHVWSGNVPGIPLWSLISSLLVKSPTVGKVPTAEPLFAGWFARMLAEEDPKMGEALGILWWKGGNEEIEKEILASAEVVVGYGGNQSLSALRDRIPATTRFLAYGHKISFGMIAREVLDPQKAWSAAHQAAYDVIRFDQQGCYSPHLFYVERNGKISPEEFAKYLGHELHCFEQKFPRHELSLAEQAALASFRQTVELQSMSDGNIQVYGDADWTVIFENGGKFNPSCLNRCVRVVAVDHLEETIRQLSTYRVFLQTAAIAASPKRLFQLAERLGEAGVNRVCALGTMTSPEPGWHHDGRFNLLDLVRIVDLELGAELAAEAYAPYVD